jgi:rare lipoprotein A
MAAGSSEVSASSRGVRAGGRRFERSAPVETEADEDATPMTRPVAAYAPAGRDNSINLMSGRGLY